MTGGIQYRKSLWSVLPANYPVVPVKSVLPELLPVKRGVSSTEILFTRYYRQKYQYYRPVGFDRAEVTTGTGARGAHRRRRTRIRRWGARGDGLLGALDAPLYGEQNAGGAAA